MKGKSFSFCNMSYFIRRNSMNKWINYTFYILIDFWMGHEMESIIERHWYSITINSYRLTCDLWSSTNLKKKLKLCYWFLTSNYKYILKNRSNKMKYLVVVWKKHTEENACVLCSITVVWHSLFVLLEILRVLCRANIKTNILY